MKAQIRVAMIYVTCPKCGEPIICPKKHSYLISTDDYTATETLKCACGAKFSLPKKGDLFFS